MFNTWRRLVHLTMSNNPIRIDGSKTKHRVAATHAPLPSCMRGCKVLRCGLDGDKMATRVPLQGSAHRTKRTAGVMITACSNPHTAAHVRNAACSTPHTPRTAGQVWSPDLITLQDQVAYLISDHRALQSGCAAHQWPYIHDSETWACSSLMTLHTGL